VSVVVSCPDEVIETVNVTVSCGILMARLFQQAMANPDGKAARIICRAMITLTILCFAVAIAVILDHDHVWEMDAAIGEIVIIITGEHSCSNAVDRVGNPCGAVLQRTIEHKQSGVPGRKCCGQIIVGIVGEAKIEEHISGSQIHESILIGHGLANHKLANDRIVGILIRSGCKASVAINKIILKRVKVALDCCVRAWRTRARGASRQNGRRNQQQWSNRPLSPAK